MTRSHLCWGLGRCFSVISVARGALCRAGTMGGMSEQPGRRQTSVGGMVGAMLVLVVGVGAFVLLRDVNRVPPGDPVRPVDYAQPARFAAEAATFELLAPPELPQGWIATSVRFDDTGDQAWHLGVLTDEQRYIGLEQAERTVEAMVADFVDEDAVEGEEVEVAGETWTRWADPGRDLDADPAAAAEDDVALVREDGGATTLLVGTVSQDQLADYAASLR